MVRILVSRKGSGTRMELQLQGRGKGNLPSEEIARLQSFSSASTEIGLNKGHIFVPTRNPYTRGLMTLLILSFILGALLL